MASRSRCGRRGDTGCGTAPNFHAASVAAKNSGEFGSPMVTYEPCTTPWPCSARAMRFASDSSCARV